jgi:flagellar basal-body rod protein FlgB
MLNGIAANLERYMDLVSFRQKLVASNIANADTPGYTTKDVNFQAEYQAALQGGQAPTIVEVESLASKSDGNNVSLDREARLLAENALRFSVASSLARGALQAVRSAIHQGRNG